MRQNFRGRGSGTVKVEATVYIKYSKTIQHIGTKDDVIELYMLYKHSTSLLKNSNRT